MTAPEQVLVDVADLEALRAWCEGRTDEWGLAEEPLSRLLAAIPEPEPEPAGELDLRKPLAIRAFMARNGFAPGQLLPYDSPDNGWTDPLDDTETKTDVRRFMALMWKAALDAESVPEPEPPVTAEDGRSCNRMTEQVLVDVADQWCPRCGKSMATTADFMVCRNIGCPCFITRVDDVAHYAERTSHD